MEAKKRQLQQLQAILPANSTEAKSILSHFWAMFLSCGYSVISVFVDEIDQTLGLQPTVSHNGSQLAKIGTIATNHIDINSVIVDHHAQNSHTRSLREKCHGIANHIVQNSNNLIQTSSIVLQNTFQSAASHFENFTTNRQHFIGDRQSGQIPDSLPINRLPNIPCTPNHLQKPDDFASIARYSQDSSYHHNPNFAVAPHEKGQSSTFFVPLDCSPTTSTNDTTYGKDIVDHQTLYIPHSNSYED